MVFAYDKYHWDCCGSRLLKPGHKRNVTVRTEISQMVCLTQAESESGSTKAFLAECYEQGIVAFWLVRTL